MVHVHLNARLSHRDGSTLCGWASEQARILFVCARAFSVHIARLGAQYRVGNA